MIRKSEIRRTCSMLSPGSLLDLLIFFPLSRKLCVCIRLDAVCPSPELQETTEFNVRAVASLSVPHNVAHAGGLSLVNNATVALAVNTFWPTRYNQCFGGYFIKQ